MRPAACTQQRVSVAVDTRCKPVAVSFSHLSSRQTFGRHRVQCRQQPPRTVQRERLGVVAAQISRRPPPQVLPASSSTIRGYDKQNWTACVSMLAYKQLATCVLLHRCQAGDRVILQNVARLRQYKPRPALKLNGSQSSGYSISYTYRLHKLLAHVHEIW